MAPGLPIPGEPVRLNALVIRRRHGAARLRRVLQRGHMLRCLHTGELAAPRSHRPQSGLQIHQPHRERSLLLGGAGSIGLSHGGPYDGNGRISGVGFQRRIPLALPAGTSSVKPREMRQTNCYWPRSWRAKGGPHPSLLPPPVSKLPTSGTTTHHPVGQVDCPH